MTKEILKIISILLILIVVQSCSSNRSNDHNEEGTDGNSYSVNMDNGEAKTDIDKSDIPVLHDTDELQENISDKDGHDATVDSDFEQVYHTDRVVELSTDDFKHLVHNMDKNPNMWAFEGALPAIVNFYAVWCAPCKMVAPYLEELAKEYAGKINIYKIDAERERSLASYFRVRGYPTFMIIPKNREPQIFAGFPQGVRSQADIKPVFEQIIQNELLK